MNVLKMIGSTAFLMANKEIIRLTDIETAILYSDLAGAQDYWSERAESQDGYFYRTQNEIELNTTLSAKVQLRCLRLLEDKGLIKTKLKGLPAKKYFCIDSECMYRLSQLLQKGETCIAETEKQVKPKSTNKSGENVETSLAILDNQASTKGRTINNRVNNNKEIIIDNNKEKTDFSFLENDQEIIDTLPTYNDLEFSDERVARYPNGEQPDQNNSLDFSMQTVEVYECYIRIDEDEDGIAELRRIVYCGSEILDDEECDHVPFHTICPIPIPHKFFGQSLADRAMDIQLIKSTVTRQMLDNLYLTNNARVGAVDGQVNLDDLLNATPGGVIRMKSANAIQPIEVPAVTAQAFPIYYNNAFVYGDFGNVA